MRSNIFALVRYLKYVNRHKMLNKMLPKYKLNDSIKIKT